MAIHIGPVREVAQRGKGLYVKIFDDETGESRWQSLQTSDWTRAQKIRERLRRKAADGHHRDASQPIGEAMDEWLMWYASSDLALKTVENAQHAARQVVGYFGLRRQLGDITAEDLQRCVAELSGRYKPRTMGLITSYLKSAYKWFLATGRVTRDATTVLRSPRSYRADGLDCPSQDRDIPDSDLWRILDLVYRLAGRRGQSARTVMEAMAWSGIRYGTLEQVEIGHAQTSKHKPHWAIPGRLIKVRRPLIVPMHPEARQAILRQRAHTIGFSSRPTDLIWPGARNYKRYWGQACRQLGLPYRLHDLRGRYENWLRRRGVKPEIYMHLLGRRDAGVMMRDYLSIQADEALQAIEAAIEQEKKA
jgi:integrase